MKILVVTHLFYLDMWEEIKNKLSNIKALNHEVDYCFTLVELNDDIKAKIELFDNKARIFQFENRGYDIGPFIDLLNHVNLDSYDLVVKLHTKRDFKENISLNYHNFKGSEWRDAAFQFLDTKKNIETVIDKFLIFNHLGMVSNYKLICGKDMCYGIDLVNKSKDMLLKTKLSLKRFEFVAGSIFICRARLLKPILRLNLNINNFEKSSSIRGNNIAYTIERLFGLLVSAQGYQLKDVLSSPIIKFLDSANLRKTLFLIKKFILYWTIDISGRNDNVVRIRLFRLRLLKIKKR